MWWISYQNIQVLGLGSVPLRNCGWTRQGFFRKYLMISHSRKCTNFEKSSNNAKKLVQIIKKKLVWVIPGRKIYLKIQFHIFPRFYEFIALMQLWDTQRIYSCWKCHFFISVNIKEVQYFSSRTLAWAMIIKSPSELREICHISISIFFYLKNDLKSCVQKVHVPLFFGRKNSYTQFFTAQKKVNANMSSKFFSKNFFKENPQKTNIFFFNILLLKTFPYFSSSFVRIFFALTRL